MKLKKNDRQTAKNNKTKQKEGIKKQKKITLKKKPSEAFKPDLTYKIHNPWNPEFEFNQES